MKFVKISALATILAILVFVGCKRENSATLNALTEEKLSQTPGELTELNAPSVVCDVSTPTSISLRVCAGPSGAPAGFTIHWMTQPAFFANGGNWLPEADANLCKASFTGAQYILAPNQCITVTIGSALTGEGVSSNCTAPLSCVTAKYVFRGYVNATATLPRSDFSLGWECSTAPCPPEERGCTYTQGYWKTHGPAGCVKGNNSNEWPVSTLTLGTVSYSASQLCSILNSSVAGNGLIALAHQLIAAKFNVANGASSLSIASSIAAADALIGGLMVPPVGGGWLDPSVTSALTQRLTNYNEGLTGPGHCE